MSTITEILEVIQNDKDLQNLVLESDCWTRKYRPGRVSARGVTRSWEGLFVDAFLKGFSGPAFRMALEKHPGVVGRRNPNLRHALILFMVKNQCLR